MTVELGVFAPGRLEILRRLLSDPSLAPEFEALQGPQGLERMLADPFSGPELRWLAFRDGEPAGFCWAFVIPTREGSFAMLRPGVVARARRTGIGSRLIETASAAVRELAPQCREHARFYWLMASRTIPLLPGRGEVATLGVVPEARGIGLGRALLRWGVGWLEHQAAPRVTLTVDGENEGALSLYRSEGFETVRKREIWSRRLP